MSSVVREASTVRHAPLGQVARSSLSSADTSDRTDPFAALLDATGDGGSPLTGPRVPSPTLTSPKPVAGPQGNAQSSPAESALPGQKTVSDSAAQDAQSPQAPPQTVAGGNENPDTAVASETSTDKNGKDSQSADAAPEANVVPGTALGVTSIAAAAGTIAGAAPTTNSVGAVSSRIGKLSKADSNSDDQNGTSPADPSAYQTSAQPQPPAAPVSAPAIPAASAAAASGGDGGAQDRRPLSGLSDALRGGGLRGKADSPGQQNSKAAGPPAAAGGAGNGEAMKPGTALQSQQGLNSSSGSGQQPTADKGQAGAGDPTAGSEAASTRARDRAASAQANDTSVGSQDDSDASADSGASVDSGSALGDGADGNQSAEAGGKSGDDSIDGAKHDLADTSSRIDDSARQAIDSIARASAAEGTPAGPAHLGNAQIGGTQPPSSADGLIAPTPLTTTAAPATAPMSGTTPTAVPISGLAVEIAASAQAGKSRFEIRLDPPDLGRIEVRLDVDRDGKVTSKLVVDRPETLDLLRRDAPELQHSLQQAGLQTSDGGLQFSLRDQGGFAGQNPYSNNAFSGTSARVILSSPELPAVDATTASYGRVIGSSAGIDIRV